MEKAEPANHGRTVFIHQHQKILKQPLEPMVCWLGLFHSEKKEVNMTLHSQTCANKIDAQD
jgi:hypothetical protein